MSKDLVLVVEQVATLSNLIAMLNDRFPVTVEKAEIYALQYRYSLKTLQRSLTEQGFRLQLTERYRLPEPADLPAELGEFLHHMLPVQDFLQEADVFAYGLLAMPQQTILPDQADAEAAQDDLAAHDELLLVEPLR